MIKRLKKANNDNQCQLDNRRSITVLRIVRIILTIVKIIKESMLRNENERKGSVNSNPE